MYHFFALILLVITLGLCSFCSPTSSTTEFPISSLATVYSFNEMTDTVIYPASDSTIYMDLELDYYTEKRNSQILEKEKEKRKKLREEYLKNKNKAAERA